jgi:ferredoxin-type protein NapH
MMFRRREPLPASFGRGGLEPADLKLSRVRAYQLARRFVLVISLSIVALTPLLHLAAVQRDGAGVGHGGPWAAAAEGLPIFTPTLGAPWSLRLFGIEFMDPLALLGLTAARGLTGGAWLAALLPLLLVGILGRFFCGWLCPYLPLVALSNSTRALLARLGVKLPNIELPRRTSFIILATLLIGTCLRGSQLAPLFYPPSMIGRELSRYILYDAVGTSALAVLIIFLFDTFVSRAGFCRSLCPGGALFTIVGTLSPIKVQRVSSACTECAACDVVCNLGQKPMTDQLDAGCERCGKCVSVCPTGALHFELQRHPVIAVLPSRLAQRKELE